MSDPFLPKQSSSNFFREVQLVAAVVFFLCVVVSGWSYFRFSHGSDSIPLHIQNAPIAQHVGPEYYKNLLAKRQLAKAQMFDDDAYEGNLGQVKTDRRAALDSTSKPSIALVNAEEPVTQLNGKAFGDFDSNRQIASANESAKKDRLPLATNASRNPMAHTAHDIAKPLYRFGDDSNVVAARMSEPQRRETSSDLAFEPIPKVQRPFTSQEQDSLKRTPSDLMSTDTNGFVKPSSGTRSLNAENTKPLRAEKHKDFNVAGQEIAADTRSPLPHLSPSNPNLPTSNSLDSLPKETSEPEFVPDSSSKRSYTSKKGDSFWSIAQQAYDDGRYFRALYEYNRSSVDQFDNIPRGMKIETPDVNILRHQYPELCPVVELARMDVDSSNTYVTKPGDTLFDIARREIGQASRYLELIQLNRDRLPLGVNHLTRLSVNIRLQLPR